MNSIQAVHQGIRGLGKAKRMWFVFWCYNLFFALALVLPLAALLSNDLGHSAYAGQMLGNFDIQYLSEFMVKSAGWPAVLFSPLALLVAIGYFVLSTFLYGGALAVLSDAEGRYRTALFYEGCGRNFGRLMRLLLVSAVAFGIVLAIGSILAGIAGKVWKDSMEARPIVIFTWFRLAFVVLLFLFVNMVFDYAKIRLVVEDGRKAARAALGSFVFVRRNFALCAGTYAIVVILAAAFYFVYAAISGAMPRSQAWGVLLVLLFQQAYVASRIWVKLLFLASQREMYLSLAPAPADVPMPAVADPPLTEPIEVETREGDATSTT